MTDKLKPIVFYITLFCFILVLSTNMISYDFDLWARLIAGMGFVQTGHVLKQDFLSYTPTHTWYDHEWGSGVIFYITQQLFGATGLFVLQSVLFFLMFVMIVQIIRLRGCKTTCAYNFLFYFFAISTINVLFETPVRCQLFSFFFFALFLYVLEFARKINVKSLWSLPFLMIVWNNLHGGCVAGIGLIAIYIVGELLNRKSLKQIYPYIYALLGTIAVLPINPWGFEYLKFLFSAATMKRPNVIEWFGLFYPLNPIKYNNFKFFASILLVTELGISIKSAFERKFDFDKTKFLVLAVTLFLGIQHIKLIPLFVISAAAFLYDDFYSVFNFLTRNFFNKIAVIKDTIVYILIIFYIAGSIWVRQLNPVMYFDKYPFLSVEFVKINDLEGNLLTNFGLGSYAAYKLYPQNKIFMDGRYEEVYYDEMMPLLKDFHLLNDRWDKLLKKYPPDIMIIENFYPVYTTLKDSKDWSLVYEGDSNFGVFVKTKDLKKYYKKPMTNSEYYKKTIFDTGINFKDKKWQKK